MKTGSPARLLAAVLVLGLAAILLLAVSWTPDAAGESGAEFQTLTGGLGLGPAIDLSRCAGEFDAREGWPCSLRHEPLPCGSRFCPAHAGAGLERSHP